MIRDFLLPSTDGGVLVQVVILIVAIATGIRWSRHHPEVRLFVIGVGLVLFGLIGLRAAH